MSNFSSGVNPVCKPINLSYRSGVARGKELFGKDCAACHGAEGEGNPAIFAPWCAPSG
jgi:mono/diheme cytochrome c family protein